MTHKAQRIAIAEAYGAKWQKMVWFGDTVRVLSFRQLHDHCGLGPMRLDLPDGRIIAADIPDYPSDLNACHEMEKKLTDGCFGTAKTYETLLARIMPGPRGLWHATATQRAEAFLRIIDKWDDSK